MQILQDLLSRAADRSRERPLRLDEQPLYSSFRAALVLLASVAAGQNIDRISRLTGVSRSFVARCARHLVDNGVWENGAVVHSWNAETALADPAFWDDVAVAEGKLLRRRTAPEELEWAAPGEWIKEYESPQHEPVGPGILYHPRTAPSWDPSSRPLEQRRHDAPSDPGPATAPPTIREQAPTREEPGTPERRPDPLQEAFGETHWLG